MSPARSASHRAAAVGDEGTDVAVLGDVMLDVVVRVHDARAHGSDTASGVVTAPGGAAANQAVWLVRAGARVALLGAVGDDPVGEAALAALAHEGVDTSGVAVAPAATGTVVALVEPDGQRSMLTDRGANLLVGADRVAADLGRLRPRHVHVSGYAVLDAASERSGRRALATARSLGSTWSLDAASAGPLEAHGAEGFLELAAGATFLFCNLDEARVLAGAGDDAAVARRLAEVAGEVVVTLGPRGAVVAAAAGVVHARPSGAAVADTVGAGDAFTGTYLGARLLGHDVAEALEAASGAAARALAAPGARGWSGYSRA